MKTESHPNGRTALLAASVAAGLAWTAVAGTTASYRQNDLVSDVGGSARFVDTNLVNPWGLLAGPVGDLVVADNHSGAANFGQGMVERYDASFHLNSTFTDAERGARAAGRASSRGWPRAQHALKRVML